MHRKRRDVLWSMGRCLVSQNVTRAWPTTNAPWTQEPGHTHLQATLRFPRQDQGRPNNGTSFQGEPNGPPGSIDRPSQNNKRTTD